jgi:hypothetical protein
MLGLFGPAGVALEELQVVDLDWPHAANRPDNARHWIGVARPVEPRAGEHRAAGACAPREGPAVATPPAASTP